MTFKNPDALVRNMDSYFISRNDRIARLGMTISTFQNIPGLVGFWPMSGVQRSTGDARDFGMGGLDLTYNGNPTYNIHNNLVPYIDFDGTGDFLERPDETDLDILGTETIYANAVRGLTMGGWFRPVDATPAGIEVVMSKLAGVGNFSFELQLRSGGFYRWVISSTGSDTFAVNSSTVSDNVWSFVVARFNPSTEIAVFLDATKSVNTTSIPASINNSNVSFNIGRSAATTFLFNGDASLCFLSANNLSDAYINGLRQQSRVLFGV